MSQIFKFILIFITFSSLHCRASEKPVILSGFDDVLRQAENTGLMQATLKIFEKDKTFSGMRELYSTISKDRPIPHFYLVSAISSLFEERIQKFLVSSGYPSNKRYLRNWLTQWSIENFKLEKIKEIFEQEPGKSFIVIFDNSDASLSLTQSLNQKFKEKILTIYLRQILKKNVPQNAVGFYTAFDIAMHEYKTHRMSLFELEQIGKAVEKENHIELIFPAYAYCPEDYDPCIEASPETNLICRKVRSHIQNLCRKKSN